MNKNISQNEAVKEFHKDNPNYFKEKWETKPSCVSIKDWDRQMAKHIGRAYEMNISPDVFRSFRTRKLGIKAFSRPRSPKVKITMPKQTLVEEGSFRSRGDGIPLIISRCLTEKQSSVWDYRIYNVQETNETWIVVRTWEDGKEVDRIAAKILRRHSV